MAAVTEPLTTVLPGADALPQVLPTDRLLESAKPVRELRDELREIADVRNIGSVLLTFAQPIATVGAAMWVAHPVGYVVAFFAMGPAYVRFAILSHEAAHRLLFTSKRWNDFIGKWFLSYPGFVPFDGYRRSHFAHHKDEFGPNEPDLALYNGYPIPADSFWRKMKRDAFGSSGWKNLKGLLLALKSKTARPFASRILAAQLVIFLLFAAVGRPELYLFLWLAPWMTVWRVINRLRAIAEHGGMTRSGDRRLTTHHVEQSLLASAVLVPFNTGWHLAHHVDMGVPWRNLPALHAELVDAGWVTPALTYPNYRSLWKALRSG